MANASIDDSSFCCRPTTSSPAAARGARGHVFEPGLPHAAVLVEEPRQNELRCVVRQPVDHDSAHLTLGESALHFADVLLDAAHHDVFQSALAAYRHAAGEAVRIEQLKQGGEAVGVAVVGCGGQEQAVLEAPAQVTDGAGELGLDAVAPAARRRRVVGLRPGSAGCPATRSPSHSRIGIGIGRVDEQVVRDQKPALCVRHGLTPKPRSRRTCAR